MLLLNCSGDCLFKMQLQEGSEDTGAGKHEAAQDTQGTPGVRHYGCALDEIRIQDAQEEPGVA